MTDTSIKARLIAPGPEVGTAREIPCDVVVEHRDFESEVDLGFIPKSDLSMIWFRLELAAADALIAALSDKQLGKR